MRRGLAKHSKPVIEEAPVWKGRLHLQPKPSIRTRRFFPLRPALMLKDYLEREEELLQ